MAKSLTTLKSTIIGVGSTAPLYSIAVTIGLVVALVGQWTPLAMALALIPMLCISFCMGRLDALIKDQGTVYRWGSEALGRLTGFAGGWMLALSGIFVLSSLAQVAVDYGLQLVGVEPSVLSTIIAGTIVLCIFGLISSREIEFGSKIQTVMIVVQMLGLLLAGWAIFTSEQREIVAPELTLSGMVHAILLGLFIYWGWDSTFSLTEESEDKVPAKASLISLVILVISYVSIGALFAFKGSAEEVFESSPLILIGLTVSALSSIQTTMIPASRGMMSMARRNDLPAQFNARTFSTWFVAVAAILWLVFMTLISRDIFEDSISAISIYIAGYYLMTAVACFILIKDIKTRLISALGAILMGAALVITAFDVFAVDYGATSFAGVGGVGLIAGLSLILLFPVYGLIRLKVKK